MEECQEPRCKSPVTKEWGGRRLCPDHYEQYEEQYYKNIMDMRDAPES